MEDVLVIDRPNNIVRRFFRKYFWSISAEEVFPHGIPLSLIDLLKQDTLTGTSEKTIEAIKARINTIFWKSMKYMTLDGMPNKWPVLFKKNLYEIYNWQNLWDNLPMLRYGINGTPVHRQYAKVLVYELPTSISSELSSASRKIKDLIKLFREDHPDELIDFVSYDIDNLHMSLSSWNFSDTPFSESETLEFKRKFDEKFFNCLSLSYDGFWMSQDSLVIKFVPKEAMWHIANQILGSYYSWDLSNSSTILNKQGWWTHITIGRFVWKCNDTELLSSIHAIMVNLDVVLQSFSSLRLSIISPKILSHLFQESWNSEFTLK